MLHNKFLGNQSTEGNFEGFLHITAWRPSWSCDQDTANKLSFTLSKETPHSIFGLISQAVSEENFFENVNG